MRAVLLLLAIGGCAEEPSFDAKFAKQSAEIKAEASKVERELKAQIELVPEAREVAETSAKEKPAQ